MSFNLQYEPVLYALAFSPFNLLYVQVDWKKIAYQKKIILSVSGASNHWNNYMNYYFCHDPRELFSKLVSTVCDPSE